MGVGGVLQYGALLALDIELTEAAVLGGIISAADS